MEMESKFFQTLTLSISLTNPQFMDVLPWSLVPGKPCHLDIAKKPNGGITFYSSLAGLQDNSFKEARA